MKIQSVLTEFRDFIARGNVVDLAVGVVSGVAFGAVVNSLVGDIITPLIAAVGGEPDFSALVIKIGDGRIAVGSFLNTVLSFLLTMGAVFLLIVKPMSAATARLDAGKQVAGVTFRECPHCLSQIPAAAARCAQCCADSPPAPVG